MNVTEKCKITFFVNMFLRAIMGTDAKIENTIAEVLGDKYIYERMKTIISDFDEGFSNKIIAALAGNERVCAALNYLPGNSDEKQQIIANRLWDELTK